eukprot:5490366-Pleurochrysis_carterae.AAC.1
MRVPVASTHIDVRGRQVRVTYYLYPHAPARTSEIDKCELRTTCTRTHLRARHVHRVSDLAPQPRVHDLNVGALDAAAAAAAAVAAVVPSVAVAVAAAVAVASVAAARAGVASQPFGLLCDLAPDLRVSGGYVSESRALVGDETVEIALGIGAHARTRQAVVALVVQRHAAG